MPRNAARLEDDRIGRVLEWLCCILYDVMQHRTQLYLDDGQYRWLKQQAPQGGSIAAVVRDLIDAARSRRTSRAGDPLIRCLIDEPPAKGAGDSTVQTLDQDLYG
jgi:hypothetical protein